MVGLSDTILAAIFAAQVAQIGFEARILSRLSTAETKIDERTEPAT